MSDDSRNGRRLIGGRSIRWDDARAASAYARGLWSRHTLADALYAAAEQTPQRVLLVDGSSRLDCKSLHSQAMALAHAMLARAPAGSVVSFMLPNWHEAAVLYLAATAGGHGGESDSALAARSRARVHFEGHSEPADFRPVGAAPARLRRDAEPRRQLARFSPGGDRRAGRSERPHTVARPVRGRCGAARVARARCGRGQNGALYLGDDRAPQGRAPQSQLDSCAHLPAQASIG